MNSVTSPYTAMVGGKSTALAGCKNTDCASYGANCLRSDSQLACRAMHKPEAGDTACRYLIPIQELAA